MSSKFRTNNNTWKTRGLFVEVVRKLNLDRDYDEDDCLFWLKYRDEGDTRPLLRELFIEVGDMTGLKFAKKHLGGWEHLEALLKCNWFKTEYEKWKEELFVTMQSDALDKAREIAEGDGATALAAAKYIANKEWVKPQTTRGRPTAEEISGELKRQAEAKTSKQEDFKRMTGFSVVLGGKQ